MPSRILIKVNLILIHLGLTSREFVEIHEQEASYLSSRLACRVIHDQRNYLLIPLVSEPFRHKKDLVSAKSFQIMELIVTYSCLQKL